MKYSTVRVPVDLIDRCKEKATVLKKSVNATAVECITDCLDQMDAEVPGVPKIVSVFGLMKPSTKKAKK